MWSSDQVRVCYYHDVLSRAPGQRGQDQVESGPALKGSQSDLEEGTVTQRRSLDGLSGPDQTAVCCRLMMVDITRADIPEEFEHELNHKGWSNI